MPIRCFLHSICILTVRVVVVFCLAPWPCDEQDFPRLHWLLAHLDVTVFNGDRLEAELGTQKISPLVIFVLVVVPFRFVTADEENRVFGVFVRQGRFGIFDTGGKNWTSSQTVAARSTRATTDDAAIRRPVPTNETSWAVIQSTPVLNMKPYPMP